MTSRERLLAVLRKQKPDRVPWSPLIDGYYASGRKTNAIEAALATGADVMVRKVPVFSRSVFVPHELPGNTDVEVSPLPLPPGISRDSWIDGDIVGRTYRTPVGSLTERWRMLDSSPYIPFPIEHLVKGRDDIAAYRYLVEHEEFEPAFEAFEKVDARIGDRGIATATMPHTPIQHLLIIHMGISEFYYTLNDHGEEMTELMDLMHQRNLEVCRILMDSPAEVCIQYENTGTSYVSPRMYEQFEMPPIDVYADMLHSASKIYLVHMCGQLEGLAGLIGRGRQDGSADIAPPPTGNWTLADARRAWPDKIIVGGLDSVGMATWSPDEAAQHAREVLRSVAPGDGIILGSGDAVALGTPPENLQAVTEVVEEIGAYPLSGS
jgi:uroporphyrinogen-III decarboxylase